MILTDTSIWVDHLRKGDRALVALLEAGEVLTHPFVVGELALGSLSAKQRLDILAALANLPQARTASDDEVLHFIDQNALSGSGIGYVDAHLLASTRLTGAAVLWTKDKRLREVAAHLGMAM